MTHSTVQTPATSAAATRRHRAVPAVFLVVGIAAAAGSVGLGLGSPGQPGPGAWPLVASLAVAACGGWLTVTGIDRPEPVVPADTARVGLAVVAAVAFVVLLPLIGMPVPAAIVVVAWMRLFGESWKVTALTAVLGVVALQVVFVNLLGVPLPVGPLAPGR